MLLNNMLKDIQIELQDTTRAIWEEAELIRAIDKSVGLMSRLMPKRDIVETTLVRTITGETLTIASSTGTLAYKPIKKGTLTITGETLDTDYRIDYLTGIVTEIGSNLADGSYTAAYTLEDHVLDISSILPDYIKIERVEYPAGDNPRTLITYEDIYGSLMFFKAGTILTEDEHLRLTYLTYWTSPTDSANGDYPESLDTPIIIGSAGQALIFKAEKYMQSAVTEVDGIITLLDTIGDLSLSAPSITAPTAPTITDVSAPAAYTVVKPSAPDLPSAPTAPTAPTLSFTAVTDALTLAETELITGAGFGDTGAALINTTPPGKDAGAVYGQYISHLATVAMGYINDAQLQLKIQEAAIQKYASQAASYGSDVNQYANQVSGTIGKYREQINGETLGINNVNANVASYQAQLAEENLKISKYAEQVRSYQTDVAKYQQEVAAFAANTTAIVNRAIQNTAAVEQYLNIAGRYLASGQAKINEMLASLGLKAEFNFYKSSPEQFE